MINSEYQPQVEKNLEDLFDIKAQADNQLVEVLQGKSTPQITASDLILSIDDVQTILTLVNKE